MKFCFSTITVLALTALAPVHAFAQGLPVAYLFGAASAAIDYCACSASTLQVGGGGEVMLSKSAGIGGELSYGAPLRRGGSGIALLSVNGSYHFATKARSPRTRPFVSGGLTMSTDGGGLLNAGGGFDRWVGERVGFRVEVRDHFSPGSTFNLLGARFGVVVR